MVVLNTADGQGRVALNPRHVRFVCESDTGCTVYTTGDLTHDITDSFNQTVEKLNVRQ